MKIHVKQGRLSQEPSEIALIGHYEDEKEIAETARGLNKTLAGHLKDLLKSGDFRGKHQHLSFIHAGPRGPVKRILMVGLGKRRDCTTEKIRQATSKAAQYVRDLGLASFCSPLIATGLKGISPADVAQAMVEGAVLGLYQFNVYKTEEKEPVKSVQEFTLVEENGRRLNEIRRAVYLGQILAEATNLARDLGNYPSNYVTPTRLAEMAQGIAGELGLECEILEKPQMEALGMGAFLGVAKGSQEPAKFIILKYQGLKDQRGKGVRPIALVGKTITFDTGGISIKPSEKMEQMKYDMMGGATVLCAIKAAAQLQLPVNIVGFMPATENMPSGTAIKPGDVVKTLSGKTVEVINTDAEGRLILADALTYATRYRPNVIVDLATLTGACTVALGHHAIGLLGNHPDLLEVIKKAAQITGERVWELPLWEEYYEQIKSDVADVKNVGGRGGGTITAAAFLSKFVGDYPWAHLDIASTAWTDENRPYIPKGVTGIGVRLLVNFLMDSKVRQPFKQLHTRAVHL
jgi:leucyl aminopeptidase